MFTITFQSHDFQTVTPPRGCFTPLRCSWRAMGGPERATIAVEGDPCGLASLCGLLGASLVIHDPQGSPYWWGYLHGIDFQEGSMTRRLSLAEMANRMAVLHTLPDGATQNLTAWADDPGSQSIYGVRERILTLESVSELQALAWRDAELADHAYPKFTVSKPVVEKYPAVLECRGWYETLGWRYYVCWEGKPAETTVQMAAIVAACGQFLAGVRVVGPSGIFTNPGREGMMSALGELEVLAGLGDASGRALRLRIDNQRVLVVEPVPRPGEEDWTLGSDGYYRDQYGVRQAEWANPAGRWVRPAGWAHAPAQTLGGGDGAGYVEEWEYRFT